MLPDESVFLLSLLRSVLLTDEEDDCLDALGVALPDCSLLEDDLSGDAADDLLWVDGPALTGELLPRLLLTPCEGLPEEDSPDILPVFTLFSEVAAGLL